MRNERTKFEIQENILKILERDGWRCQWPGCCSSASECAHLIAKTQSNTIRVQLLWNHEYKESRNFKWIWYHVINNELNMKASCRHHNDNFNCGNRPDAVRLIVEQIHKKLTGANK